MKCYRCNNELNDDDEVCSKCGSKVVKLKKKREVRDFNYSNEYYGFAISALITKIFSVLLAFISIINLLVPWLLLSLIFSLVGLIKYKDKRNIKIIIIDGILIVIEIILIIIFFEKISNLF